MAAGHEARRLRRRMRGEEGGDVAAHLGRIGAIDARMPPHPAIARVEQDARMGRRGIVVVRKRAERFARAWGSRFVNVGALGHINSASGLVRMAEEEDRNGVMTETYGVKVTRYLTPETTRGPRKVSASW